uniref:Serpentine receptor class gamma n=1 Tax=Parastrongyloides trichosuri TaxID=131310 RepID=A0A0N4ZXJ0_PARTI
MALSSLTVTFNRYYCIKYPLNYKFLFRGWKLFLFIVWPLSIALPIFIIYCTAKVAYVEDDSGRLSVGYIDSDINNILWYSIIYTHLAVLILNAFLNFLLIKACRNEVNKKIFKQKNFKMDVLMAKFALIYFTVFTIVFITEVALTLAMNMDNEGLSSDILSAIPVCQSLLVFSPLYTLLILSDDLRVKFLLSFNIQILNNHFNKGNETTNRHQSRITGKTTRNIHNVTGYI